MPRSSAYDPYRKFKFRIKIGGSYVAGLTTMSALSRTVSDEEIVEGGNNAFPYKIPGRASYATITLERGITQDTAFEEWANAVNRRNNLNPMKDFKRDIEIEVFGVTQNVNSDRPVVAYKLHNCWVSKYEAMPGLDANSSDVAIESIEIQHEGWDRL